MSTEHLSSTQPLENIVKMESSSILPGSSTSFCYEAVEIC